jgi:Fic family protein
MAIIHPFYDGNGRLLNILYLITQDLLDVLVLYLSRRRRSKTLSLQVEGLPAESQFSEWPVSVLRRSDFLWSK